MTTAAVSEQSSYISRVQRKKENLELAQKNRRERECFWTWPFGHVTRAFKTNPLKMMVGEFEESVRILILQCEVCGHERRIALDWRGNIRTELNKRIWKVDIPLPQ